MSYDRFENSRPPAQEASASIKVRSGLRGWTVTSMGEQEGGDQKMQIQSFSMAIRLDTPLTTGTKGFIPASKLIWVSSSRDHLAVKTLEAVLIPN